MENGKHAVHWLLRINRLLYESVSFFLSLFLLRHILACVAVHSPAPPSFIYWYKEGRVINYSQRGGISVLTERKTRTSKLVISKAMSSDSGNYTCIPSSSGKFFFYFFLSFVRVYDYFVLDLLDHLLESFMSSISLDFCFILIFSFISLL